jgi:cell division initiation protein
MKLTPLDIHHKEFRTALRGYNEKEVDAFLDQVADEFERLFKENVDLSERLTAALERVKSYEEMKDTLQNTLIVAQKHAEDVESDANKRSELMTREADLKSQQIVGEALAEKQRIQQEVLRIRKAEEEYRAAMSELLERQIKQVDAVPVPQGFPTDDDIAATRDRSAEVAMRAPSNAPSYAEVIGAAEPAPAVETAVLSPAPAPAAAPPAVATESVVETSMNATSSGVAPSADLFEIPDFTTNAPPAPPVAEAAVVAAAPGPVIGATLQPPVAPVAADPAAASGLTLGEVEPPDLDIPAFTDPAEFKMPGYGAADADADIEEID